MSWAKHRHSDWSTDGTLKYRVQLFATHKCAETLRNIEQSRGSVYQRAYEDYVRDSGHP
jgi:hypothetical protein